MKSTKIKDIWDFDDSFIFSYLATLQDFSLWTSTEGTYMDIMYLSEHSAEKPLSSLTEKYVEEDGTISTLNMQKLANIIYAKYKRNWKQFNKYDEADYDIWDDVENETRSYTLTDNQKPKDWKLTVEGSEQDNNGEVNTSIYGFNSEEAVPSEKVESKSNSKSVTEQSGSFQTDHRYSESVFKKGSSKLRTGAEMMQLDLDFWDKWSFIEEVFRDVDEVLCGNYYESNVCFL